MSIILALILTTTVAQQTPAQQTSVQPSVRQSVPVEVFQVMELPITMTDAAFVKTKDGYLLKCLLSNNSEFRVLGMRYSLAVVDSMNAVKSVVTINEGFKLDQYQSKSMTFKTPLKLKRETGDRLVLMVEQIFSTHYVWNVMKAKESLTAYINGDYSLVPRVLRILNQIDAPPRVRMIY